jgi:hypothetical protein
MKNWRSFERLVALLTNDAYEGDHSFTVIPNAKVKGIISQRKRQIDVLVEHRYRADLTKRIIFDAKNRTRPVDIKEVESFEGFMKDTGAKRGFLVCINGYTKAALKRAQMHIGIKLVTEAEIEDFSLTAFEDCRNEGCASGLVLWDTSPGIEHDGKVTVQGSGKCDECGLFHVWCWGCGQKQYLANEDEWQCACKEPWFWMTCIEPEVDDDGNEGKAVYLLLVSAGNSYLVDRRPL